MFVLYITLYVFVSESYTSLAAPSASFVDADTALIPFPVLRVNLYVSRV